MLRQKADDYVLQGHIDKDRAEYILLTIEAERGHRERLVNDMDVGGGAAGQGGSTDRGVGTERLTRAQMLAELEDRVEKMRCGAPDGEETDQMRVYTFIIDRLNSERPLRLMVQASAGPSTRRRRGKWPRQTLASRVVADDLRGAFFPSVGTGKSFLTGGGASVRLADVFVTALQHDKRRAKFLPTIWLTTVYRALS